MVLKHYYDIGVAVGAAEGLVVPVLRDAETLGFADIEKQIREFAKRAEDGTLSLADLKGGTFTITNGGVFGSLLSTPILNPPQVGILGLHAIQDRPIAVERPGPGAADDVRRAHLRSPHRRRRRGGAGSWSGSRSWSRIPARCCSSEDKWPTATVRSRGSSISWSVSTAASRGTASRSADILAGHHPSAGRGPSASGRRTRSGRSCCTSPPGRTKCAGGSAVLRPVSRTKGTGRFRRPRQRLMLARRARGARRGPSRPRRRHRPACPTRSSSIAPTIRASMNGIRRHLLPAGAGHPAARHLSLRADRAAEESRRPKSVGRGPLEVRGNGVKVVTNGWRAAFSPQSIERLRSAPRTTDPAGPRPDSSASSRTAAR